MDVSLKYFYFNLLRNDKILVCQPDIEASWVGRVIPPLPPSEHYSTLTHIVGYYSALSNALSWITAPYLGHPSPVYYRGWPSGCQFSSFQSHRKLQLEMKIPEVAVFMKYHTDKIKIML